MMPAPRTISSVLAGAAFASRLATWARNALRVTGHRERHGARRVRAPGMGPGKPVQSGHGLDGFRAHRVLGSRAEDQRQAAWRHLRMSALA
jgi:hypothetical protein